MHHNTINPRTRFLAAILMLCAIAVPVVAPAWQTLQADAATLPSPRVETSVQAYDFQCAGNLLALTVGTAALVVGAIISPPTTTVILLEAYPTAWAVYSTWISCTEGAPPDGCIDWAGVPYAANVYVRSPYCNGGGGGGGGGGSW